MTGDKDLFQLVNSHVVWRGLKDDLVYDVDAVVKRYGVSQNEFQTCLRWSGMQRIIFWSSSIGVVRGKSQPAEFEFVENIVNLCKTT